jgi:uncharacterized surface protein with fasciclin (FAS1) repeats
MKLNGFFAAAAVVTAMSLGATSAYSQVGAGADGAGQLGAGQGHISPAVWTGAQNLGFQEWGRSFEAATDLHERIGDRPHTAFIADDMAYGQVDATQRQAWQADPQAQRAALGHTIVEGRLTMEDLRQRDHVMTIDGQRVPVRVDGDNVWVGDARITRGDLEAGTSAIHQVDRVTWPTQQTQQQTQPGVQGQQMQPQTGTMQATPERVRKN